EVETLAVSLAPSQRASVPRDTIRPLMVAIELPTSTTGNKSEVSVTPAPDEPVPVLHQIKMAVGPEVLEGPPALTGALRHPHPEGRLEDVLLHCMNVALEQHRKARQARVQRPRPVRRHTKKNRTVPAAVRREVWARDEGRCTFVSEDGKRCGSTKRLEFH